MAIRQVQPSDREALTHFYAGLSDESRRSRFLGVSPGISGSAARSFCTLDHVHDQGFVATLPEDDGSLIVGHVCMYESGPRRLELGIAVADGQQGRGIGRALFGAALEWAEARHFTTITASCMADNTRVLALLSSAPFGATFGTSAAGVVELTVPLQPPIDTELIPLPPNVRPRRRPSLGRSRRPARVWRHDLGRRPDSL